MNPFQIIATLRKFGNYLAGLFPALVPLIEKLSRALEKLASHEKAAPLVARARESQTGQSLWKFIERFYWRTYSKDRLALEEAPAEAVPVIRPVFQLCAMLCALIPITQLTLWPTAIETFSGFKGSAPAWSILLWPLALAIGWSALLIGAACCNRLVFAFTALASGWFLSTCVLLLPRSWMNLFLPAGILLALAFGERRKKLAGQDQSGSDKLPAAAAWTAIATGCAAGIPAMLFTPLKPYLTAVLPMTGAVIGIGGGALIGLAAAFLVLFWARLPAVAEKPFLLRGGPLSMAAAAQGLTLLLLIYLGAGTTRGSLAESGGLILSSLSMSNRYLWPVWYYIGVGIMHKLMGSSKVVAQATQGTVEGLMGKLLVTPFLLTTLLLALLAVGSEPICLYLSSPANTTAGSIGAVFLPCLPQFVSFYHFLSPIWSNPLNAMTAHWLSWVLLADLVIVITLTLLRRLHSAAMVRLLFMTSFATLLIQEYLFQLSSFTRSPSHSLIALSLFAIWLLWLTHTVGFGLSCKSTPAWPSEGRFGVYGGIVALAMLEIHARAACQDFKLMNELFLTMFRGVIDIGLPYYLLIWTSRKTELKVSLPRLLGLFCAGALAALGGHALAKLTACSWSLPALQSLISMQLEAIKNTGSPHIDLSLPAYWLPLRSAIFAALLWLVCRSVRKSQPSKDQGRVLIISLVAFASGIAAFSNTMVDLPGPAELGALIAPLQQELLFNCNVFQCLLSYWIPALTLGLGLSLSWNDQIQDQGQDQDQKQGSPWPVFFSLALFLSAALLHLGIAWLFTTQEAYLRAAGAIYTALSMVAGVFVILVAATIKYLEKPDHKDKAYQQSQSSQSEKTDTSRAKLEDSALLTAHGLIVLVLTLELALLPLLWQELQFPMEKTIVDAVNHEVWLSKRWRLVSRQAPATFQQGADLDTSTLQIGTVPSNPDGTRALLKSLMLKANASGKCKNLSLLSVTPWDRYRPGALACQYSFETPLQDGSALPIAAITVLFPPASKTMAEAGKTEFCSLYTSAREMSSRQWELALMLEKLGRK